MIIQFLKELDDTQANIIKDNKIEEINGNIKSNQNSDITSNKEEKNIREFEELIPNIKVNKKNNINKSGLPNKAYFIEKYKKIQGIYLILMILFYRMLSLMDIVDIDIYPYKFKEKI